MVYGHMDSAEFYYTPVCIVPSPAARPHNIYVMDAYNKI